MRALLDRFRPRSAGLRLWLGLSYGLLAIGLVGALSLLVERAASQKMQLDIGLRLASNAKALADRMDEGLYERLNDVRTMTLIPGVERPMENQALLRDLFDMMQLSYPDYAWIGVADGQGRVQVASRGMLEGLDLADRDWVKRGLRDPYVGDIRKAILLAQLLPVQGDEPLRLIDVAAPIHDAHGVVVGVVGAHLSWQWAENQRLALQEALSRGEDVEVFVLNRQGVVVLGPKRWRDETLRVPSAARGMSRENAAVLETWPDGRAYLTGFAPTQGRNTFDNLGWTVLVRKDAAEAFVPVVELRRQIWLAALALTLVFLLAATLMARWIGAPLLALANTARRLQAGEPDARFPPETGYREARQLTAAMRGLVDELTAHERELTTLAQQLEQRVRDRTAELSEANAQLEVLAMTDGLTGLSNRRHFGDQLAREATRAAEAGKPIALVMLDIDHFKAINDQHGHPAGDAVLRRVALLLEEQVRGNDLLARVGGEEFAVLALEASVAEASQLGERLRATAEANSPVMVGRSAVPVTVSVGVAVLWPRPGDILKTPERLLAAADDALYRAKRNGRNRVEVAVP
ncbi:sensor domain-containing diguanylate cyclase [Arenimonas sp. MALMAid1274]|uniref:sensor domain-containing diguanylate cyclase n=1 Tax=Arenimonas sp. MALMAid1274 TaxID=3411630 RepID=UPI003B9F7EAE